MGAKFRRRNGVVLLALPILALAAANTAGEPPGSYTPVAHPKLEIQRTSGEIRIDGRLDDPGWQGAVRAGNFAEHNPGDQTRPEVDTQVWVAYDEDNFYVAWLCYDDPDEVRASFCERDEIFTDDYVILCLDPFGDATLAYEIASNPRGIPGDLLYSSSNGEDITYDMIFESEGRLTDFGWVVEMAVPFSSMRFPDLAEQTWRVDFWRNRPRESRFQYSWAVYDRDENCWPCQWGTVNGITGVTAGAGLELLPAVVAHQSGALGDGGRFENDDAKGDVALGVAYDFSSELTAETTINPDFSQVESDAAQIDVNTTFALFYPERRPFFQEGSDLFDTYFEAVYTRSVNDPIAAGKVTWRRGSSSVAVLSARDDHSVIILPFEESSAFVANGRSISNVVRARRDFGNQSNIGFVATDRHFDGGGSGSLAGVDGKVRLSPSDAFTFQILGSYTDEVDNPALTDSSFSVERFDGGKYTKGLDGEKFWGHGAYGELYRSASDYWFGVNYWERSPTFRADNGFEPSNATRYGSTWVGGVFRFENSDVMETVELDADGGRKWNFDGVRKDEWVNLNLTTRFKMAQTAAHTHYLYSNELFGGIYFQDIWRVHQCFSTQPASLFSGGGYINYGHRIARSDLKMGKQTDYGVWADVRPIHRLLVSSTFDHIHSDNLDTGERLFSQSIFRSKLSVQATRELSARLVVQYNNRYDSWEADPLFTYRINSFSIFYIGSTHNYRDLTMTDDGRQGWTLTERQYFLKLQYLFQI